MVEDFSQKTLKLIGASVLSGAAATEIIEGLWAQEGGRVLVAIVVLFMALYIVKLLEDEIIKTKN